MGRGVVRDVDRSLAVHHLSRNFTFGGRRSVKVLVLFSYVKRPRLRIISDLMTTLRVVNTSSASVSEVTLSCSVLGSRQKFSRRSYTHGIQLTVL